MQTSIFEARCDNCKFCKALISKEVVEYLAESHMMETGHTVDIIEVI